MSPDPKHVAGCRQSLGYRLSDERYHLVDTMDMPVSEYVTWLLDIVGEHVASLAEYENAGMVVLAFADRVGGPDAPAS